jgi:hypothetical protein
MDLIGTPAKSSGASARWRLVTLSALALLFMIATPGEAAAPEHMGFGTYGEVRVGDTHGEVLRKVSGVESCHRLGGRCVCASVEVGERNVTFVYRLDLRDDVDLIFTNSSAVPGPREIRVGDTVRRLKTLFPHAHRVPPIYGSPRFVVNRGRIGLLALARGGRITQLTTGRNRFFDYVEYCS